MQSGQLVPGDQRLATLPADLAHTSADGEVVVVKRGEDLTVVFFDFRGINHYTGWVYSSNGKLDVDPLGNRNWTAETIGPNWFRVDAS